MKRFDVRIVASAGKELASMPRMLRERIIEKFDEIRKDPRGMDADRTVLVTRIRHRREVYRRR